MNKFLQHYVPPREEFELQISPHMMDKMKFRLADSGSYIFIACWRAIQALLYQLYRWRKIFPCSDLLTGVSKTCLCFPVKSILHFLSPPVQVLWREAAEMIADTNGLKSINSVLFLCGLSCQVDGGSW